MTVSEQPTAPQGQVRPHAAWYLLVVVLWVASAVLFGTAVASFVRVIDHGVTPIQGVQVVQVPDSGLTVYSRTKPVSHDCTLQNPSGQTTDMEALSFDVNATFDGTTVYAVAITPDGLPAGPYRISCPGVRSQLYYGDKFPVGSLLVRIGISVVLGLVGLVLLIVLLVKRHTSKSRIRTQNLVNAQGSVAWPPGFASAPPPGGPYGQPPPPSPYQQPPASYQPPPYNQPPYNQPPYNQPPYNQPPPEYDPQHHTQPLQQPYPQQPYPQQQPPPPDDDVTQR